MNIRGIRGAVVAAKDEAPLVLEATRHLLQSIQKANPTLSPEDLASILFTVTPDLKSAYPARAAREMGWQDVPLMCAQEIPVPEGLPRCIRILIHWNTNLPQSAVSHVYLGEAARLRPEWTYFE